MFNSKNLSPARLAFFISLIITLLVSMFLFFFTRNLQDILITFAVVGIVSYLLIYYVIERFIYRKIKLIYKFISQTKATKREEYFANELLPQKTIEEVRDF